MQPAQVQSEGATCLSSLKRAHGLPITAASRWEQRRGEAKSSVIGDLLKFTHRSEASSFELLEKPIPTASRRAAAWQTGVAAEHKPEGALR